MWRNHYTEGYKIGQAYTQQPMDLSNYLFIRTRENMLLQNKVNAPQRVLKSGKTSRLLSHTTQQSLTAVEKDLGQTLPHLTNMLYVLSPDGDKKIADVPVAFASNTLYVLERNNLGGYSKDAYERLLVPVLKAKADYLHAEGVAQAVWALAHAELTSDKELWGKLKALVMSKDFAPVIVKNERWSAQLFTTHNGGEHFFESELSEFADQLFFRDHLALFEVYNGLQSAHAQNKSLGLDEAIKHLENTYGDAVLRKNNLYLEIEATHNEAVAKIAAASHSPSF